MDFFDGLFEWLVRWMFILMLEVPTILFGVGWIIWGLVKWTGFDSHDKQHFIRGVFIFTSMAAGMQWFFHIPNFLRSLLSLTPIFIGIAIAGWLFFQFAITGFASQIDEGLGNLREIAQNSRRDKL